MTQKIRILMANMLNIDPLARVWHGMYHERIGKKVMAVKS
jgi:lambda repressor-like predicted transcriptional regulator